MEQNGDGIGEPVTNWPYMLLEKDGGDLKILTDDEFDGEILGLQWQWQANPKREWYALGEKKSCLRLYVQDNPVREENLLWYAPNALTQIPQSEEFQVEAKLCLTGKIKGDQIGIGILGHEYTYLALRMEGGRNSLVLIIGKVTGTSGAGEARERLVYRIPWNSEEVRIRISMQKGAVYSYTYSADGKCYKPLMGNSLFSASACTWTGMKLVLAACNIENKKAKAGLILTIFAFNELK